MCGIVGIVARGSVNQDIYDALTALQHRGQDASGIVTCEKDGKLHLRKALGLVRDVVRTRHMYRLKGHMGMGHVRYGTAGTGGEEEAQPFYVNSPYGITLAHNGNLTNAEALADELFRTEQRHLNTHSDSEVLLNVFAHELQSLKKVHVGPEDVFKAVSAVYRRCRGAYAAVAMITGHGIVAFRDPRGIRPLVYGVRDNAGKKEYMVSSETVVLDALGFKVLDDVQPGEGIFITEEGELHKQQCAEKVSLNPCIFEFVYLARPDSFIDKISVYKVRLRLGEHLADKILTEHPNHDIDVVMPIPDTSRTAAASLAIRLGVKFREGFIKNRYIGRTFIMSGQKERCKSVRNKLNAIPLEFKDKNVLLVDDSIVRGTTCKEIIQMARKAGAKKVYFASAAPAVRYPNVYGIDMPSASELIAHDRDVGNIGNFIGADWLIYQDLNVLVEACQEGNDHIKRFEDSVFTGDYITGDIDKKYLDHLETLRNDAARQKGSPDQGTPIDLFNVD